MEMATGTVEKHCVWKANWAVQQGEAASFNTTYFFLSKLDNWGHCKKTASPLQLCLTTSWSNLNSFAPLSPVRGLLEINFIAGLFILSGSVLSRQIRVVLTNSHLCVAKLIRFAVSSIKPDCAKMYTLYTNLSKLMLCVTYVLYVFCLDIISSSSCLYLQNVNSMAACHKQK